jgi:hypothetical protein
MRSMTRPSRGAGVPSAGRETENLSLAAGAADPVVADNPVVADGLEQRIPARIASPRQATVKILNDV